MSDDEHNHEEMHEEAVANDPQKEEKAKVVRKVHPIPEGLTMPDRELPEVYVDEHNNPIEPNE